MIGSPVLFHEAAALAGVRATIGSPLYDMLPEHVAALVLVLLMPIGAAAIVWLARDGRGWAQALVDGHAALDPSRRAVAWLLATSAVIHLGLGIGHGTAGERAAFILAGAALAFVAWRLVAGRGAGHWRPLAAIVLLVSIVAYWLASFAGSAPDQVGLATKVVELLALALVLRPASGRRWRGAAASALTIVLVVGTGAAGWIGSFVASGATAETDEAGATNEHLHGPVPPPGVVLPALAAREPTPAEAAAADALWAATAGALEPFADPAAAAAAGYQVGGPHGLDFHAGNASYESDGRVLDPQRPESLVYAVTPDGRPVLLGAVFVMPGVGLGGPAVGGPLTTWHGHENVCVTLIPPSLTGLQSPLGGCPVGSITIPATAEMIHVWTVPGAPTRFGDLDAGWRTAYVAALAAAGG